MSKKKSKLEQHNIKKVAIYIRVSTVYQVDKDSLSMQRNDLISYAEHALKISDYEIFEDAGYSGKNTARPAYQRMMLQMRDYNFSHLLVWKLDRISRNLLDFSEMYEELQQLHVTFISKNEQFDTSTAIGEAILKIILVFAELERNMTSERVTATMISRATQGQWNGGQVPYGYNYDKETKTFTINENEADVCRKMRDLYLKTHSLIQVCRTLNNSKIVNRTGKEWDASSIWYILSSPFYIGTYRYNQIGSSGKNADDQVVYFPDHHPAIFTADELAKIKAVLAKNFSEFNDIGKHHTPKHTFVFGGLCYCGRCGSRYSSRTGRKQVNGYLTTVYQCRRRIFSDGCKNPSMNDLRLGEFALNYLHNILIVKDHISEIKSLEEIQTQLLMGYPFSDINHIDKDSLNALANMLHFNNTEVADAPPVSAVQSDSELDFISQKSEIESRLNDIEYQLNALSSANDSGPDDILSDTDFFECAGNLRTLPNLQECKYGNLISYKELALSAPADSLKSFFRSVISRIYIFDGKIQSITFRNGLTHNFIR